MEAVILAAGWGTRLKPLTENFPKPLLRVAGRELLYRHLRLLSERGVSKFWIIINPKHRQHYQEFRARHPEFDLEFIENPYPERGNGYSFYLAKDHVKGPLILTMGDHVYEKDFVIQAVSLRGLIIDREGRFISPEEATKALCLNGHIKALGKDLKQFTGFDTGFFVLHEPQEAFSAAERLLQRKKEISLSEVMVEARIPCAELSGYLWMDVDTPADLKRATRLLVKHGVKGGGDGLISRYLNRKVSTWVSARVINFLSPNQATLLTTLLGLLAAATLAFSPKGAALLYQLSSMLDGMDGEIARASLRTTSFGGWLDSVLDRLVDFAFLAGLYLVWQPAFPWQQLVALCAFFGAIMVSYTAERYYGAFQHPLYQDFPLLRYIPGKRDERVFLIMLGVLAGKIWETFLVLALITNLRVFLTLTLVCAKNLGQRPA